MTDVIEYRALDAEGIVELVRFDHVMTNPPLCITAEQFGEGFAIVDEVLSIADAAMR